MRPLTPAFTAFFLAHVTGSTGSRQRTQPKATLVYPMPAPRTEAIEDFCAFADPIYEQIKANELESKQLEELRDALLPRLMSGEINVSKVDLTQLNSHLVERWPSPLQLQDLQIAAACPHQKQSKPRLFDDTGPRAYRADNDGRTGSRNRLTCAQTTATSS